MPKKTSNNDRYDRFSSAAGVAKIGTKSPYADLSAKKMKKSNSKTTSKKSGK